MPQILRWIAALILCASPLTAQHEPSTEGMSEDEVQLLRTARNLHNQSRHHYDWGRYEAALSSIRQALEIVERLKGQDDPLVELFLNDMAYYYKAKGELGPVEDLLSDVLRRVEQREGPKSLAAALSTERLAVYYLDRGLGERAKALFQRAHGILLELDGQEGVRPNLARVQGQLATCLARAGDLDAAEAGHREALRLIEEALGPGHVDTGKFVNDLALFLSSERKAYPEAELLLRRLLIVLEEHEQIDQIRTLRQNLGMLFLRSGNYTEAEELLKLRYEDQRADPILEEMGSPKLAISASNLGELYWAMGKLERATELWGEAIERYARFENAALAVGSEQDRLAYAARLVSNRNATISMHLQDAPDSRRAAENALVRIVRTKGRVLEAQADTFRGMRGQMSFDQKELFLALGEMRSRRAYRALQGAPKEELRRMGEELSSLETDLAEYSSELVELSRAVTLTDLRKALGPATLVEFIRYQPFDVGAQEHLPPRYAAYVLNGDDLLVGRDLGPADEIEARIEVLRTRLVQGRPLQGLCQRLYADLVAPWIPVVAEDSPLLLAPDALLHLLPFGILAEEEAELLTQASISYLNSGRQLLSLGDVRAARGPALILADPDFGQPNEPKERAPDSLVSLVGTQWTALPETRVEAQAIRELLPDARVALGAEATEQALRRVAGPRILHVATHGFFLGGDATNRASLRGITIVGKSATEEVRVAPEDSPLLRSGLVLAGANVPSSDADDGYLTALEATGLDLHGTQLVVLSACETGVGSVISGQGVFGLRRAIALAGAQTQVMSLWKVGDEATAALMTHFYRALANGEARGAALRRARLALRADKRFRHPFFWGAFVLSGDWTIAADK